MSFSDIAAIIKKETWGSSKDSKTKRPISTKTQAMKLYKKGKSPVDVPIKLDVSPDEAERWYIDYWNLKRQHRLAQIYEEIKVHLPSFFKLFKSLRSAGITEEDSRYHG